MQNLKATPENTSSYLSKEALKKKQSEFISYKTKKAISSLEILKQMSLEDKIVHLLHLSKLSNINLQIKYLATNFR